MSIEFPGGDVAATVARLRALADDIESLTVFQPREELAEAPFLDEWCTCLRPVTALVGQAAGHPRLPKGPALTSELYAIDVDAGWARTFSRFYKLGRPAGTESFQ